MEVCELLWNKEGGPRSVLFENRCVSPWTSDPPTASVRDRDIT